MEIYKYDCPIIVQASNIEEAKKYLETRLMVLLLHPDGVNIKDIKEKK